jgi:hypothetical protein
VAWINIRPSPITGHQLEDAESIDRQPFIRSISSKVGVRYPKMVLTSAVSASRAAFLRNCAAIRSKSESTQQVIGRLRRKTYHPTQTAFISSTKMAGLTPAWRRHLIRKNREELLRIKTNQQTQQLEIHQLNNKLVKVEKT